jgi:hypothetical protein
MSRTTTVMAILVANCLGAGAASAQSNVGARAYVTYGPSFFSAADSFEAVAGSSRQEGWGGGGQVTGLWRGLFLDVAVAQQTIDGERVFVSAGTVYRLGIPLTVRVRPVDVAAGWRFLANRISPYVGGGLTVVSYRETSPFADAGDDVRDQQPGALVLGGVDVAVARWLFVGGEVRYRVADGILGVGGASQAFGEDDLGGVSTAFRISVGR